MAAALTARTPIQLVKKVWERIAPLSLAETSWDNVGVIMEAPFPNDNKQVLLTIDLTPSVCAEALASNVSVVISYHPPIFRGLKSMTMDDPLQSSLLKLSAKGISVFSPHTSLDATPKGINNWLVEPFQGTSEVVDRTENPPPGFEGAGMGRVIKLSSQMSLADIVPIVKKHLGVDSLQIAKPATEKPIKSIAVCAGSGGSVLRGVDADLLLTGEMSHHEVLATIGKGQAVLLANHTNTERGFLRAVLREWLEKELAKEEAGWKVAVSEKDHDPLRAV